MLGANCLLCCRIDEPGGCACNRLALGVGPIEGRAAPGLDIDSQVPLVPGLQCWSVLGLEEDAADASDSLHGASENVWCWGRGGRYSFGHIIVKIHPASRAYSSASTAFLKVVDHLRLYQMDSGTAPIA